MVGLGFCCFGL